MSGITRENTYKIRKLSTKHYFVNKAFRYMEESNISYEDMLERLALALIKQNEGMNKQLMDIHKKSNPKVIYLRD